MLGIDDIIIEIDKKKLLNGHTDQIAKSVFITRMCMYLTNSYCFSTQRGFIPDLFQILEKYDLLNIVKDHIFNSITFPNKHTWKTCVKRSIIHKEDINFKHRIDTDPDFSTFKRLHNTTYTPAYIWLLARETRKVGLCENIAKLWVRKPGYQISVCHYCEDIYKDLLTHVLTKCPITDALRSDLLHDTSVFRKGSILLNCVNNL